MCLILRWVHERNTTELHIQVYLRINNGCSKHVEDTIVNQNITVKSVHFVGLVTPVYQSQYTVQ